MRIDSRQAARNAKKVEEVQSEAPKEDVLARRVVDATFSVHNVLGPGLLEHVYEIALAHELRGQGLKVERQVAMPVRYKNFSFDEGFKADLVVEDQLLIELKSVEALNKAHHKQLLTYLRLSNKRLGLLINFGARLFKDGVRRVVNGLSE